MLENARNFPTSFREQFIIKSGQFSAVDDILFQLSQNVSDRFAPERWTFPLRSQLALRGS
jgi:hypothetical protein